MPDNVETMTYFGQVPWHGHGELMTEEETRNMDKARVKGGIDWPVDTQPLFTRYFNEDGQPVYIESTLGKSVYRMTDRMELGHVGNGYVPYQNKDGSDWFQPFLDEGEARIHTCGALDNGKVVWYLAELCRPQSEIAKNDYVSKFLLLSNSHDGTKAIRVGFTPIRVVCANTLAMAHSASNPLNQYVRVRHSTQAKIKVDALRDVMNLANQQFEATAEQYRFLASKHYNQTDIKKFVKMVLKQEDTADEDLSTRTKNQMEAVMKLVEFGLGNNTPEVRGTWWAAYNGATQYLNYDYGRNSNNRLKGLWFGQQATLNQTLLDSALALAV